MAIQVLMLSRALLGICVGGFLALGTVMVMRSVAPQQVPAALAQAPSF